jgi:hypothetical protein
MEGTFQSVDPLAYTVNSVSDLDQEVVTAFNRNDRAAIKRLCAPDTVHYDLFICINKGWHAFVLCVPVGNPPSEAASKLIDPTVAFPTGNLFEVPDILFCDTFELCFDQVEQRMYKIKRLIRLHKEIKEHIKRSYYIARFSGLNRNALQFAAARAAPRRYRVLLDDCVEFSKCFCIEALAYSNNYKDIEDSVNQSIGNASASGLSVENLSRRIRSSGWVGNTLLGGTDISQIMSGRRAPFVLIPLLLIWPVVAALIVVYFWGGCNNKM